MPFLTNFLNPPLTNRFPPLHPHRLLMAGPRQNGFFSIMHFISRWMEFINWFADFSHFVLQLVFIQSHSELLRINFQIHLFTCFQLCTLSVLLSYPCCGYAWMWWSYGVPGFQLGNYLATLIAVGDNNLSSSISFCCHIFSGRSI